MRYSFLLFIVGLVQAQNIDLTRQGRFEVVSSLPAICSIGQQVLVSTAVPGQNIYVCMSLNTWVQQSVQFNGLTYTATFSATPTFDLSQGGNQKIILSGTVTSMFLMNIIPNFVYNFWFCQDGIGNHSVTGPAGLHAFMSVGLLANKCSFQGFLATDSSNLYAITPGVINQ